MVFLFLSPFVIVVIRANHTDWRDSSLHILIVRVIRGSLTGRLRHAVKPRHASSESMSMGKSKRESHSLVAG